MHIAFFFFSNSRTKYIIKKKYTAAGNSISEICVILLDQILREFSWAEAQKLRIIP